MTADNAFLHRWRSRINRAKKLHYKRQRCLENINNRLGIAVIILSIISFGLSFWSLAETKWGLGYWAAFSGGATLTCAIIQLLFGNLKGEALQHQSAAKAYNALQAKLEQAQSATLKPDCEFLRGFRKHWRRVDRQAPYIPPSYYRPGLLRRLFACSRERP